MKFAFSTLGVPGLPLGEVARLAARTGYDGVELRAHPEEPVHTGIGPGERAAVRAEFAAAGVEVLAVAGYVRVAEERDAAGEKELADDLGGLVELAAELGAPYVRVFPGGGDRPAAAADADAARRLAAVAPLAAGRGVRVLLETHDSHRTGADAARVLGPVGHGSVGAVWDVLHTWLGGEEPAATHAALAPHLGYVQVKDVASADDTAPLPLGAGALPLAACLAALGREDYQEEPGRSRQEEPGRSRQGEPGHSHREDPGLKYGDHARAGTRDGWLCWEYEKRWFPQAPELPALLAPGRAHLLHLLSADR